MTDLRRAPLWCTPLLLVVPLLAGGCSSDSTGPRNDGNGNPLPPSVDLTGSWKYYEVFPGGKSYWVFELSQSGSQLSGRHIGGVRIDAGGTLVGGLANGSLAGEIHGDEVVLRLNAGTGEQYEVRGTVQGTTMSGSDWLAEPALIPPAPSDLEATALSDTEIGLSWNFDAAALTGGNIQAAGFLLEWRCCGEDFQLLLPPGESLPIELREILLAASPATTFSFRMQTRVIERWQRRNFEWHSDWSPNASATTESPPAFATPPAE